MPEKRKVSIIMPYYNGSPELAERAVRSVLDQEDFPCWELLIADDGSSEENREALRAISQTDARIRVLYGEHGGVSRARNAGIAEAAGEYVTFLDADDMLAPWYLREAYHLAEKNDIEFLIGGTLKTFQKPQAARALHRSRPEARNLNGENAHWGRAIMAGNVHSLPWGSCYVNRGVAAKFVRRELAGECPFAEDVAYGEDSLWNLSVMKHSRNTVLVEQVWYFYFCNEDSVTQQYNPEALPSQAAMFPYLRRILDLNNDLEYRAYCERLILHLKNMYDLAIGRKEWKVSRAEKKRVLHAAYTEEPYAELASDRAVSVLRGNDRKKAILYRRKLLFLMWKAKDLLKKNEKEN